MEIDGFLTNGDMGWLDEDGCLFLADRKNDMVISGGVNIYPAEIEKVLIGCPGVRDCAVFGIPDAEFGESWPPISRSRTQLRHRRTCSPSCASTWPSSRYPQGGDRRSPAARGFEQDLQAQIREPYWAGMPRRI